MCFIFQIAKLEKWFIRMIYSESVRHSPTLEEKCKRLVQPWASKTLRENRKCSLPSIPEWLAGHEN
jgi:hypothetical protein